ncbi:MAG: BamA/TamA family outer membrane protein [Candidatus Sericytochromatia bacterium]
MKKSLFLLTFLCVASFSNKAKAIDIKVPDLKTETSTDLTLPKLDDFEKIKVTDVAVRGTEKKESVLLVVMMKVGDSIYPSQIKEDLQRIYGLGIFKEDLTASKEPYLDGFRIIFTVHENDKLNKVSVKGNTVVKSDKVEGYFHEQLGKTLNYNDAREAIENIRKLYNEQGYQAVSVVPQLSPDGRLDLVINEGLIEKIELKGNNLTKREVILREVRLKEGDILNFDILKDDLRRIYNTNFFETVNPVYTPGEKNKNHIVLTIEVKEKNTGSVNLGAGYNTRDGIVGNFSLAYSNVFGTGQNVGLELQAGNGFLGTSGANYLGKIEWYDPWFLPQFLPPRTGVGFSIYRNRQGSYFQDLANFNYNFDRGNAEYRYYLVNDRTGASFNFSRALFGDPLTSPWRVAFSMRAERIEPAIPRVDDLTIKLIKDEKGNTLLDKDKKPTTIIKTYNDLNTSKIDSEKKLATDIKGGFDKYTNDKIKLDLPASNNGFDNRFAVGLSFSYDTRDFIANPRDGWNNSISIEPSFGDLSYWKFFGTFNKYSPIPFTEKIPFLDKVTFALGVRGGYLLGTSNIINFDSSGKEKPQIPLYERFYSGIFDTIRGWPENGYLSGEASIVGSAELRFPIYNIVSGVLFFDAGNFWDKNFKISSSNIKLDPRDWSEDNFGNTDPKSYNYFLLNSNIRYGFGAGLRLETPLGSLRADYGIRDITQPFNLSKGAQFHFSIGQKF